jgi:purine-binding chemotaxis protein CheW
MRNRGPSFILERSIIMAQRDMLDLLEQQEDTQKGKFLTFNMGNEMYGIEIRHVTEIVGIQHITEVPELPEYIRGIINLRGKIIPVMDVRLRFKKPFREYNDRTCVIVIDINDSSVGLIVDSVSEVINIPEDDIVPPPEINKGYARYIKGIGKVGNEAKLLLDCQMLLTQDELEDLSEAM